MTVLTRASMVGAATTVTPRTEEAAAAVEREDERVLVRIELSVASAVLMLIVSSTLAAATDTLTEEAETPDCVATAEAMLDWVVVP